MVKRYLVILLISSLLVNLLLIGVFVYRQLQYRWHPVWPLKSKTGLFEEVYRSCPDDTAEIIFLGNSITKAFQINEYHPEKNIKNRGIWGNFSADILRRVPEITSSQPKSVFIMMGVIDILFKVTDSTLMENYNKTIDLIHSNSPGTHIYIQSILPVSAYASNYFSGDEEMVNKRIIDLNERLKQFAYEPHIEYIDLHGKLLKDGELNEAYSWDGVHINAKGYKIWYEQIVGLLNR